MALRQLQQRVATTSTSVDARASGSPQSLATVFKEMRGRSGQELELEGEHVARKVDALRDYHLQISHMFGKDLRLNHRLRAFAAGPPRHHRRYVERVWWPT